MAVKSRPESSGKHVVSTDDVERSGCVLQKPTRRKMDAVLNSVGVQLAVVIIVFIQLPLLGTLLMMDLKVIRVPPHTPLNESGYPLPPLVAPPGDNDPVVVAERILHTINIVILLLFLVEIILRVSARGSRIHTDGLQVFDCGIVMLTFVLYIAFTAANMRQAAYGCGLLILLRLWRIHRIGETIAQQERRKLEKTLAAHRKAQKDAEEQLKQTTAKLAAMQQEMDVLQQQLKVIHYIGKASPAISSSAYSKVSEDMVTSDDESERYTDCDSQVQTPKILDTIQAEMTVAGLANRRFYSHTTSNTPSPATSFSHLVDEFLLNSEFRDFKDLSSLSKSAPTKVSVPDLVEHLQDADGKVKGQMDNNSDSPPPGGTNEEADLTRDSGVVLYNQSQHQQHSHKNPHPSGTPGSPPEEVSDPALEAGSPKLSRPQNTSSSGIPSTSSTVPRQKEEEQQLITGTSSNVQKVKEVPQQGHDNLAFESEVDSKEQEELQKISTLPLSRRYGSSTYLNEDGIPMTDL